MKRIELPNWETVTVSATENLSTYLNSRVIGQPLAINSIVRAFNMGLAGLLPSWRPIAVLFFAGPTGVGKTESAVALSDFLHLRGKQLKRDYPSPPLVRVDAELFGGSLDIAVSRLIGAPPPYIGSRSDTKAPAKPLFVQENFPPDWVTVLLFDEIEKAFGGKYGGHQGGEMMGILMKMLDQGELVNHWDESKPVSFRKTIIIFTSNIGAKNIAEAGKKRIGFFPRRGGNHLTDEEVQKLNDTIYESTKRDFEEFFPPELRNRMDRLIVFRFLTRSDFSRILETIEIPRLRRQFEEQHGILVEVAPSAREWLLSYGVVREEGVRSLHRAILRKIVNPLATYLNAGLLKKSDQIVVEVDNPKEEKSNFRFFNTKEE